MGFSIQLAIILMLWGLVLTAAGVVSYFYLKKWNAYEESGAIIELFEEVAALEKIPNPSGWYALGSGHSNDSSGWQNLGVVSDRFIDGNNLVVRDMRVVFTNGHGLAEYQDLAFQAPDRVDFSSFRFWQVGLVETSGNWLASFGIASSLSEEDCLFLSFLKSSKIQGMLFSTRSRLQQPASTQGTYPVSLQGRNCATTNFIFSKSGVGVFEDESVSTDCFFSLEEMTLARTTSACAATDPVVQIGFVE